MRLPVSVLYNQLRIKVLAGTVLLLLIVSPFFSTAQTLFSFADKTVTKKEFLEIHRQHNPPGSPATLSQADYLELYIRFRLKVEAARQSGIDTLPEQVAELQSFRHQLAENHLKEDASVDLLVEEAFDRSRKDIHISHWFIPLEVDAPPAATAKARQSLESALEILRAGRQPADTSILFSSAGYVTVFVLPYEVENIVYQTPATSYSRPFRTTSGYHLIQVNHERPAVGQIRAAQILIAFPPDAGASEKNQIANRADSVYQALQQGADFTEMARKISDDPYTYLRGGELPAFGVGQYDTLFEKAAFSLKEDGEISRPVRTEFGYHIIKRIQRVPVPLSDAEAWKKVLREIILQGDRMEHARSLLINSIRKKITGDAPAEILDDDSATIDWYRSHLEKYDSAFATQLQEFREGNMLFAIMQKKIWDPASDDSVALINFHRSNAARYRWDKSADAILVTAFNAEAVRQAVDRLKTDISGWREWPGITDGLLQVDSGRFEFAQLPLIDTADVQASIAGPLYNQQDSSGTVAKIIRVYKAGEPKDFENAKGAVISDYQQFLEEQWIAELKKKYRLKINKRVAGTLKN